MRKLLVLPLLLTLFVATESYATVRYVKPAAAGMGDGSSWANASADVQAMINACSTGDELWVAGGTYIPQTLAGNGTRPSDRAFVLKAGVAVYGGFAGTETIFSERNLLLTANASTLSGDFDGDDGPSFTNFSENAFHVVIAAGTLTGAILDGFTIYGGNADSTSATITVNANVIERQLGGGIYCRYSSPSFTNIKIASCSASYGGGGIMNFFSSPTYTNLQVVGCSSPRGGGIYNRTCSSAFTNVSIIGNYSSGAGIGGGIYSYEGSISLTNATLAGNFATTNGGAIYNTNTSNPAIRNSIIYGNSTGVFNVSGNVSYYFYSLAQGLAGGSNGNLNGSADPLFINPISNTLAPTTAGDYRVQPCSPLTNAGSNTYFAPAQTPDLNAIKTDLDGQPRFVATTADIGAYEYQLGAATIVPNASGVVFVNKDGLGNGSTWACATGDIQAAINATGTVQVWVAGGTYISTRRADATGTITPNDRNNAFVLKSNVAVYGGFAGTETTLAQRDLALVANASILSGDLNGDDGSNFANNADNAHHVVVVAGNGTDMVLDGFTIQAGNAGESGSITINGETVVANTGGGIVAQNTVSAPVFSNLTVTSNAAADGGGVYLAGSNWNISGMVITNNTATNKAGGLYLAGNTNTMSQLTVTGNTAAGNGGGVYLQGSSNSITSSVISGNSAANGGGWYANTANSLSMVNNLLAGNVATSNGGAIYNNNSNGMLLVNNTLGGNHAVLGGAYYGNPNAPTIQNSIVFGNSSGLDFTAATTPTLANSLVQGYTSTANGNINGTADPLFTAPLTASATPSTTGDYTLQNGSPAIDAGNNGLVPGGITTDIAGGRRIRNVVVDIGAYETLTNFSRLYVDSAMATSGEGGTWATAFKTLHEAIDVANLGTVVQEIWVRKGTYYPTAYPAGCSNCSTSKHYSFRLLPNVAIYGGFAGTESTLAQRDLTIAANASTLSGDLLKNDGPNFTNMTDNCVRVVLSLGNVGTAQLNGFTVRGGIGGLVAPLVVGGTSLANLGGGMLAYNSNPIVANTLFTGNSSDNGGGMALYGSTPVFSTVHFINNVSVLGGGLYLTQGSSVALQGAQITGNQATGDGGGISIDLGSSIFLSNVQLKSNNCNRNGGGLHVNSADCVSKLVHVTVSGNSALWSAAGGGLYLLGQGNLTNVLVSGNSIRSGFGGGVLFGSGQFTFTNCTVVGNQIPSYGSGGGIYASQANLLVRNSILYNNYAVTSDPTVSLYSGATATYQNSLVQGSSLGWTSLGTDGGGNIDANPVFVTPSNLALMPNTLGDYRLYSSSPAVNTGSNSFFGTGQTPLLDTVTTDLAGIQRIQGGTVNMGAYEEVLAITGPTRLYVDSAKTSSGDGSSWANAYKNLGEALLQAENQRYVREIWVRKGTYYPTNYPTGCTNCTRADQYIFNMVADVAIYGGFAGTETTLAQRNLSLPANASILSGDLDKDDGTNFTNMGENSECVVMSLFDAGSARLDGFKITGGNNQNFNPYPEVYAQGGGLSLHYSSPVLENLTVTRNQAEGGGGLFSFHASPTISHCVFSYNKADYGGGGISLYESNPTISYTDIIGNEANDYGGGLYDNTSSNPSLSHVNFIDNRLWEEDGIGGGYFIGSGNPRLMEYVGFYGNITKGGRGGGLYKSYSTPLTITNAVFKGNVARSGGGLCDYGGITLTNTLFTGNKAANPFRVRDGYGGAIYSQGTDIITNATITGNYSEWTGGGLNVGNSIVRNSIVYGNASANGNPNSYSYECLFENSIVGGSSGGWPNIGVNGGGNLDADPKFASAIRASLAPTVAGDFRVQTGSPALNAGSNIFYAAGQTPALDTITVDLAGNARIQATTIDMGAYEGAVAAVAPIARLYVDSAIAASGNGQSWATPYKTLQEALEFANNNTTVTEIWVRKGTYYPSTYPSGCAECSTSQHYMFQLVPDVAIYGGFAGTETSLAQRNLLLTANASTLSGDLNKDDGSNFTNRSDNTMAVVLGLYGVGSARLDGFTVRGTNCLGLRYDVNIYIQGGGINLNYSNPVLQNLIVTDNYTNGLGGGLVCFYSSPTIRHCVFSYNKARFSAGGIALLDSYANISYTDIIGNVAADEGGGLCDWQDSYPSLSHVNFINNRLEDEGSGGGMSITSGNPTLMEYVGFYGNTTNGGRGGGLHKSYNTPLVITHAVFKGNLARSGGGLYDGGGISLTNALFASNKAVDPNDPEDAYGSAIYSLGTDIFTNITVSGNYSDGYGGSINADNGVIRNSIFFGNGSVDGNPNSSCYRCQVSNSIIGGTSGGWSGAGVNAGGNLDVDPRFANPKPWSMAPTTAGDYTLLSCSPAINTGSNTYYAVGQSPALDAITQDVGFNPRFYSGGTIDMGAFEYQGPTEPAQIALDNDMGLADISAGQSLTLSAFTTCRYIATVQSNGTSPVNDSLRAKVWVDNTIPYHNLSPYVQRHFEITPAGNSGSATAKITLYFTQAEFDAYNVAAAVSPNFGVPASPADALGKASLRVYKIAGESTDGTGLPNSYPDPSSYIIIDPADTDIVWNAATNQWEISFDITGFSGFFVGGVSSGVLPIRLLSFTGILEGKDKATLQWRASGQEEVRHYVLERSADGSNFQPIATTVASQQPNNHYQYVDVLPTALSTHTYFYRLKIVAANGNVSYSQIVKITSQKSLAVRLFPVPAKDFIWLDGEDNLRGTEALLLDMQGKVLQKIRITDWPNRIATNSLAAGFYILRLNNKYSLKMAVVK